MTLFTRVALWLIYRTTRRAPDFIIGGRERPYLLRWYLTPWRGWWRDVPESARSRWQRFVLGGARLLPNVYLHQFRRSDDDRALHDHPWLFNASVLLDGRYIEHTIDAGGIHRRRELRAGALRLRWGRAPHRVELIDGPCWTLFVMGPVVRQWGFHCPAQGWVHWRDFTAADDAGAVGRGCES